MAHTVAPHAGAWIEIYPPKNTLHNALSLPTRERGLKYCVYVLLRPLCNTRERGLKSLSVIIVPFIVLVAPHAGAWIEIIATPSVCLNGWTSLPTRERGLKCIVPCL